MIKEDLQKFCDPIRKGLTTPWNANGFTYASNGVVGIRVNEVPGFDNSGPDLEKLIKIATDSGELYSLDEIPASATQKCAECDGTGKAQKCLHCDGEGEIEYGCEKSGCYHYYTIECHECEGTGKNSETDECEECEGAGIVEVKQKVKFGNRTFYDTPLRLIATLPGVRLSKAGEQFTAAYFTFDEGIGLIMPMRG
jgi:hypothetical protein